ncbi:uncharacterized peroxidase-related enzyme [Bryocella elongata]|uniref:Uncharacterized peroxidase-related enzyme n=1 Tax=Bryocella elongata TaxID=863522 RepID=A0A1H5SP64_9BACT|nr:peroxidase-related enzyme [Bryocella elongata]SEF51631.1 uncharacterized peroxidase-related enzyme [Bryocella elongata]
MSRLSVIDPATSTGKAHDLLSAVKAKLGIVPNLTRVMANSPAVLEGYLGFSGALAHGQLDARLREQLALAVSQENGCDYCLSAHSAIGKMVGLKPEEIIASREGKGTDHKTTAALTFAHKVVATRGKVTAADVDAVRAAGFSDGEIAEILAHVALNVFTNYFNNATEPEIDFPKVSAAVLA